MTAAAPACQPPQYPRRFGWPMRIFLTLFIAALTYRCFSVLYPLDDWRSDYGMRSYPRRLSTPGEREELARKTSDDNPHPVLEDVMLTADSVWDFMKPWPDADTRPKIKSWSDSGKVAACWLNTRLCFVEHVCALDEGWPMFSPSVASEHVFARARLFYHDDSEEIVRQTSEPADYGHFWRWFNDKRGNYERRAAYNDDNGCQGYCNWLAHRYTYNAHGEKLVKIVLFQIKVVVPPPGTDPVAHFAQQNRLTADPPRRAGQYRSERAGPATLIVGGAAGLSGGSAVRRNAHLWTPQVLPDFYEFDVIYEVDVVTGKEIVTGKGTMLGEDK
jgi:hypothetical protein